MKQIPLATSRQPLLLVRFETRDVCVKKSFSDSLSQGFRVGYGDKKWVGLGLKAWTLFYLFILAVKYDEFGV